MTKAEISSLFHEAVADPDFVKAQERMHTIAQKVGAGNSDWTEYLHLLGHGLIESPPASAQMYMNLEDALRFNELHLKLFGEDEKVREQLEKTRLKIKWNNKDGAEMQRQVQPIKDVLSWMKGNAPFEWAVVNQHYDELVQERSFALLPKDFKTDWLTPTERAEIRYEAFFDALELLPDGSVTLQALYKNEITNVQQTLLSKRAIIKAELPPPPKPKHTIPHTVDMVHEMLAPSADPMTQAPGGKNLRSVPNPSTPTAAEKRIAEQFPTQGVAPRDGKRRSSASRKPPDARDK
jgi:hypothetical protein